MGRKFTVNDKVVISEPTWASLQLLDEGEQLEAIRLLLNYKFYGKDATIENPRIWTFIFQAMAPVNVPNQECAKSAENEKFCERPIEHDIEKILKFKTNECKMMKTAVRNYNEDETPTISVDDIISFTKKHLHD